LPPHRRRKKATPTAYAVGVLAVTATWQAERAPASVPSACAQCVCQERHDEAPWLKTEHGLARTPGSVDILARRGEGLSGGLSVMRAMLAPPPIAIPATRAAAFRISSGIGRFPRRSHNAAQRTRRDRAHARLPGPLDRAHGCDRRLERVSPDRMLAATVALEHGDRPQRLVHPAGIASTSITSTPSPGKIVK
jgi:hypothetical protein